MALSYGSIPEAHIRLLHLQPSGERKAVIEATLKVVPLDATGEYEALSYVWGQKTRKRAIKCDAATIDATENLVNGLKHLRHPDRTRVLWVDAICINQGDNAEKSHQVAMMGAIYERAKRVLIWLGPAEHRSALAFDFINRRFNYLLRSPSRMQEHIGKQWNREMGVDSDVIERHLALRTADEVEVSQGSDDDSVREYPNEDEHAAIVMLLQRQWWTRVWIIQELCLGREVVVVCGNSSVPWEAITFAVASLQFLDEDDTLLQNPMAALSKYRSLATTRVKLSASNSRPGLLDALSSFRWFRATDPIDKVYALLSIVENPRITPDYTISLERCYKETARRIIKESDTLDILDHVVPPYPLELRHIASLPSWAPDWGQSDISDRQTFRGASEMAVAPLFDFIDEREADAPIYSSGAQFDDNGSLVLRGMVVDIVDILHGVVRMPSFLTPDPPAVTSNRAIRLLSLCRYVAQFVLLAPKLLYCGGQFVAYCQSLIEFAERATKMTPRQPGQDDDDPEDYHLQSAIRLLSLCMRTTAKGAPTAQEAREFLKEHDTVAKSRVIRFLRRLRIPELLPPLYYYLLALWAAFKSAADEDFDVPTGPDDIGLDACRRPAITRGGRLCFTPHTCHTGDRVALLRGARRPYIVRDAGSHRWEVVGPCYVSRRDSEDLRELWLDEKAVELVFN